MIWAQSTEDYLDANNSTKALEFEIRIHNQYYYNWVYGYNTNLPISKAPENEDPASEIACANFTGCTEVDMELSSPALINANFHYFWDQKFDSERTAVPGSPDFWSELAWCNKIFSTCNFDETGWMEKKVDMQ